MRNENLFDNAPTEVVEPVCKNCYVRQLKALLQYCELNIEVIENILHEVKNNLYQDQFDGINCILCGRDPMVSTKEFPKLEGYYNIRIK